MIWKAIYTFPLILGCIYSLILLFLFLGLFKAKKNTKIQNTYHPVFVSVIVAARNEEINISACLNSLINQTYNKDLYEVIIVDDNSTDKTFSIAHAISKNYNNIKLLKTSDGGKITGKQRALDIGIRASKGLFILTMDADCQAQATWIEDIVKAYDPDVGLVAGYSTFQWDTKSYLKNIFYNLQHLDQLSLYAISIGSVFQGLAWTCTGNNLSYRRELYDELGGFEALGMTGLEDNMLIQWAGRNSNWKIKALPFSIVYTRPMNTISKFLAQRKRWSSSNTQYRLSLVAFMVLTYLLYMAIPFMICLTAFSVISYKLLFIFLGLKIIPEFLLVSKGLTLFHKRNLLKYFLLLQPIHVIYVLICGIFGLSSAFVWKGRKYGSMGL